MRVKVTYRYMGIPVEVEISSKRLQPEGISTILGTILSRLNRWVEEIRNEVG